MPSRLDPRPANEARTAVPPVPETSYSSRPANAGGRRGGAAGQSPVYVRSVWIAEAPVRRFDRLFGFIGNPAVRAIARYVVGALIALYVLVLGWLISLYRPARHQVFRVFGLLPRLMFGGRGGLGGVVSPADEATRANVAWFVLVGWWAGLLWVFAAWLGLLAIVTVPASMRMLAMLDRVMFLPRAPR